MKKVSTYKGFTIAIEGGTYYLFTKEEWSYGRGYRTAEWEAGSMEEARNFIDSY